MTGERLKDLALSAALGAIVTGVSFWILVGGKLATQTELNGVRITNVERDVDAWKAISQQTVVSTQTLAIEMARLTERLDSYLTTQGVKR